MLDVVIDELAADGRWSERRVGVPDRGLRFDDGVDGGLEHRHCRCRQRGRRHEQLWRRADRKRRWRQYR
jgi:hypothetical protein